MKNLRYISTYLFLGLLVLTPLEAVCEDAVPDPAVEALGRATAILLETKKTEDAGAEHARLHGLRLLAARGNSTALDRLRRAFDDPAQTAAAGAELAALDDAHARDILLQRLHDENLPLDARADTLTAFLAADALPPQAENLAAVLVAVNHVRGLQTALTVLSRNATEQSLPALEQFVRRTIDTHSRDYAGESGADGLVYLAIAGIEHAGKLSSADTLEYAVLESPWPHVAARAAEAASALSARNFAVQVLQERIRLDKSPAAQLRYAGALAAIGDRSRLSAINEAVWNDEPAVRAEAYQWFSRIGDRAYIMPACVDVVDGAPLGFEGIIVADQLRTKEKGASTVLRDYLLEVLDKKPVLNAPEMVTRACEVLLDSQTDVLTPALTAAVRSLRDSKASPEDKGRWQLQLGWSLILIKSGDDPMKETALKRLTSLYTAAGPEQRVQILEGLMRTGSTYLLPYLHFLMDSLEPPEEQIRAATAWLAIAEEQD